VKFGKLTKKYPFLFFSKGNEKSTRRTTVEYSKQIESERRREARNEFLILHVSIVFEFRVTKSHKKSSQKLTKN